MREVFDTQIESWDWPAWCGRFGLVGRRERSLGRIYGYRLIWRWGRRRHWDVVNSKDTCR